MSRYTWGLVAMVLAGVAAGGIVIAIMSAPIELQVRVTIALFITTCALVGAGVIMGGWK